MSSTTAIGIDFGATSIKPGVVRDGLIIEKGNVIQTRQDGNTSKLISAIVAEIERLKADLLAAREKNGIFFSEDTWNQMNVEHELTRTTLDETKRQVEIVEKQLKDVQ